MISALNSALQGTRIFSAKAEDAAQHIVQAGGQSQQANTQAAAAPRPSGAVSAGPLLPQASLATGITDLKQAEIGYTASARVAAAIADTENQVLDLLS